MSHSSRTGNYNSYASNFSSVHASVLTKQTLQKAHLPEWKQQGDFPAVFQHEVFATVQNEASILPRVILGCFIPGFN